MVHELVRYMKSVNMHGGKIKVKNNFVFSAYFKNNTFRNVAPLYRRLKLVVLYKRPDVLKAVNTVYFLLGGDAVYSGTNNLHFRGHMASN